MNLCVCIYIYIYIYIYVCVCVCDILIGMLKYNSIQCMPVYIMNIIWHCAESFLNFTSCSVSKRYGFSVSIVKFKFLH